jgi:hypothetical protein
MLAVATTATSRGQSTLVVGMTRSSRRYAASSPPILGRVVTNVATGSGAPAVMSGTQKWTGTAPSLKESPASTAVIATASAAGAAPSRPGPSAA